MSLGREQLAKAYVRALKQEARKAHPWLDPKAVAAAIERNGHWETVEEWRLMTETTVRIEPIARKGTTWFRSTVTCDWTASSMSPNLDRAIEWAALYFYLHIDLFAGGAGWPSWVSDTEAGFELFDER